MEHNIIPSEASSYILAAKCFYAIFALCSAIGVVCNSILLITTIRSKSLRSSCNILIGSCAFFDLGTFTQSPQIFMENTMDSRTNATIMFMPEMGVAAGSFAVLSIGIDRFLSVAIPNRYQKMNASKYLFMQYLAISIYCAYNIFLIIYFFRDHDVVCNMPSVFHDNAVSWWAYTSAAVNGIAFVIYMLTWRLIKAKTNEIEVTNLARIFRTIVLVTIFDLSGWATTQTLVASQNFMDLRDDQRLCYVCFASIFVNLGIAVKLLVYYSTSTEYRREIRHQFHLRDESRVYHLDHRTLSISKG